jgi:hypothetical protein
VIIEGIAKYLEVFGIGTWSTAGTYGPSDIGIYRRVIPAAGSHITLTPYGLGDDILESSGQLEPGVAGLEGLQVRTRANSKSSLETDQLANRVFRALHGARYPCPGVTHIWRQNWTSLGQDPGAETWARVDNYHVRINWRQ